MKKQDTAQISLTKPKSLRKNKKLTEPQLPQEGKIFFFNYVC